MHVVGVFAMFLVWFAQTMLLCLSIKGFSFSALMVLLIINKNLY